MAIQRYSDLLRDPRWQRKRLEVLNRENFRCQECYATDRTLHVHHVVYRRDALPWEYSSDELVVLCEECHSSWHEDLQTLTLAMRGLPRFYRDELIGYARARQALSTQSRDLERCQLAETAAQDVQRVVGACAALFASHGPMDDAATAFRELFSGDARSIDDPWVFALALVSTGFGCPPGSWLDQFWSQFAADAREVRSAIRARPQGGHA